MDPLMAGIIGGVIGLVIGLIACVVIAFLPHFRAKRAQNDANKIINDANIKAEKITKSAQLDAKQIENGGLYMTTDENKWYKYNTTESEWDQIVTAPIAVADWNANSAVTSLTASQPLNLVKFSDLQGRQKKIIFVTNNNPWLCLGDSIRSFDPDAACFQSGGDRDPVLGLPAYINFFSMCNRSCRV